MRRLLAVALAFLLAFPILPVSAAQDDATINGKAESSTGETLGKYTVQLTDEAGNVISKTISSEAGEFSFTGLKEGKYVVQVLNAAGEVVGSSGVLSVAAGATLGITVTAAAAAALTTAGISTALLFTFIGTGGLITGLIVNAALGEASPSR